MKMTDVRAQTLRRSEHARRRTQCPPQPPTRTDTDVHHPHAVHHRRSPAVCDDERDVESRRRQAAALLEEDAHVIARMGSS